MIQNLLSQDGSAFYFSNAIAEEASNERDWLLRLVDEIDWEQEVVNVFGPKPVPRLTAYYGEFPYRYSGVDHPTREFPEILEAILGLASDCLAECLPDHSDFAFNSVLCNYYRGGNDSMGWHRDNEPEIDTACIASLSFGAARRFKMRHRDSREVVAIDLEGGSILMMVDCQDKWEHGVPKTKKDVGPRINLTFRRVVSVV